MSNSTSKKGMTFAALGVALIGGLIMAPASIALTQVGQSGGEAQCAPTDTGGSDPVAGTGEKYLFGDSIAEGLKGKLSGFTINGKVSRTLKQGLNEIDADKATISKSGTVVIELGTNKSADFKADADRMVKKVRSFNPNAQIYWVQISSNGNYTQENKTISGLKGVSMITTKGKNITLADGIHPNPAGYQKLATVIDTAVNEGGTTGTKETTAGEDCPTTGGVEGGAPANCNKLTGTPKNVVDTVALPIAHEIAFKDTTPNTVETANAAHSTQTVSGNISDHKGPPARAWAADISNGGSPTPEMDMLAKRLANCFGIQWSGSGGVTGSKNGYRIQLIYRTPEGSPYGNHMDHVHIGVGKE